MKNVYMVQASGTYGGDSFKAAYFPYAVGLLVAYAWTDEAIKSEYEFKRFVFTREKISEAVASLDNPAVIGFSNYVWNTEYNKAFAKKVKAAYPDCAIVFGGHNVPPREAFLKQFDYIDFLIHGEGEEAFRALLLELAKAEPDFSLVPNISFRSSGGYVNNPVEVLTKTDYPSPYLTGLFDKIIRDNPGMQLDAILETSRGCPRSCAYCDWGCNSSRVKVFSLDRVFDEIKWFGEHKVAFIWGADANFGEYERDLAIVDKIIEQREKTGCPERFRINYAKGRDERVFAISRKLDKYGLSKEGATLSFQSLNPETLKIIGRHNMSLDAFKSTMEMYKREGVTTYSELILGLPGETYQSFCRGMGKLIEAGQHRCIYVYNCVLLPNSPMGAPEFIKKYGIRSRAVPYLTAHSADTDGVQEVSDYVVGTSTMDGEDWIRANIFYAFIASGHFYGLLNTFAMYLHFERNKPYEEFYDGVMKWAESHPGTIANTAYKQIFEHYRAMQNGEPMSLPQSDVFGDITWNEFRALQVEAMPRLDDFYAEMRGFVIGCGMAAEVYDELVRYQLCALKIPGKNNFSDEFSANWCEYFRGILGENTAELRHEKIRVSVNNKTHPADWREYALEAMWFGKNGASFNPGVTYERI